MPVLSGQVVPPSPPPPRPVERLGLTWYPPDGRVWELTVPRAQVRAQATSAFSAASPVEITLDASPRGGADIRHAHPLEGYLIVPVLVRCSSHMELTETWRDLGDAFTQTLDLGPGVLRVTRPDGSWRDIEAVYWSGWEGVAEYGWDWDVAPALTLVTPRPFWRAPAIPPVVREFGATRPFLAPFMTVSSSRVLGDTTIVNEGTVTAWPVWELRGPFTELVATNHTTGETFVVDPDWDDDGPLGGGETVTISTDPLRIRGPAGQVWTGAVTGVPWGLARGENQITFNASGAGAGTRVSLTYRPLYRTA